MLEYFYLATKMKIKIFEAKHKTLNLLIEWSAGGSQVLRPPDSKIPPEYLVSYPEFFWAYRYIYVQCTWVELKEFHYGWELC